MQIIWAEETKKDFRRIRNFLIPENPNAASKAVLTIREKTRILSTHPESGTALNDKTNRRELYIKFGKNGYTLRYVPDYDTQTIQILRVWHTRKNRK